MNNYEAMKQYFAQQKQILLNQLQAVITLERELPKTLPIPNYPGKNQHLHKDNNLVK